MRKKNLLASCMLVGMLIIGTVPAVNAFAGSLNENRVESTSVVEVASNDVSSFLNEGSVGSEDASVGNFIKNHRGATSEQMNTAAQALSPITNILGYLSGGVVAFIMAAIFFITALDLLYIAVPPVRQFLYTPGTDGTGAMTAGRGGYGMGGYGGMGGMGGQQQAKKPIQLISDEAVQCVALLGGSSTTEGMGAMNRMGGGYGSQPQAQMSKGSVIKTYFVKRAFFMVLLVICIIVLSSSVLLGTGVNLANWGIKLIDAFNKMTVAR